jgi:hypothetical protein
MRRAARIKLVVRVTLATGWAGLLVVAGVWALTDGLSALPLAADSPLRLAWRMGGITAIAMGQLVFSALVADRLFPHANGWLCGGLQCLAAVGFLAGLVVLGYVLLSA